MKIGFVTCFDYDIDYGDYHDFGYGVAKSFLEYDLLLWEIGFLHFGYSLWQENGLRRLLRDRQRRLNELSRFLSSGKTLVILLGDINRLRKEVEEHSLLVEPILKDEGISLDTFDAISFLPSGLEKMLRHNIVEGRGKRIDFIGDEAFLAAWQTLHAVAWYDTYFTSSIGEPFLFVNGTDLSVGTWVKYLRGNVFFIPATEYDDNEDHHVFVEAAAEMDKALNKMTGRLIEVLWNEVIEGTYADVQSEKLINSSGTLNASVSHSRRALRELISKLFDEEEFRTLCFDLGIRYDHLSGRNLSDRIRELIFLCERKKILSSLKELLKLERPQENWDEL